MKNTEKLTQQLYERAIIATDLDITTKRQLHNKLTEIRAGLEMDKRLEHLPYTKRLIELVDGWEYQTLVHLRSHLDVLLINAKKEKPFPTHSHGNKQIITVLHGVVVYNVEGEDVVLKPGNKLSIDPNTVHSAMPETDCQILHIYMPPITIKIIETNVL